MTNYAIHIRSEHNDKIITAGLMRAKLYLNWPIDGDGLFQFFEILDLLWFPDGTEAEIQEPQKRFQDSSIFSLVGVRKGIPPPKTCSNIPME